MTYRIRTVSELTGIPRNTLIAWERRYGFVRPQRHGNSYRNYSDADIAKLKRVKAAIGTGLSVSEAIALLNETDAQAGALPTAGQPTAIDVAEGPGADPFRDIRGKLYDALTSYRGASAERLLAGLLGVAAEIRIHQIYFPILRQIGDAWEVGELTVAQEHFAAAILREQMVSILVTLSQQNRQGLHAACTTFVGDTHEFGALAMAVRLCQVGYRVSHLGPNLPASDLGDFCRSTKPDLVCVSSILRHDAQVVAQYAEELRQRVPKRTRLVIGGCGIDVEPRPKVPGVELIPNWDGFVPSA